MGESCQLRIFVDERGPMDPGHSCDQGIGHREAIRGLQPPC